MPAKDHIHTYVRAIGRITPANEHSKMVGYYKCADPECSHYTKAEMILGKKSICTKCRKEFILPIALRSLTNKPHCKDCFRKKYTAPKQEIRSEMEEFLDLVEVNEE